MTLSVHQKEFIPGTEILLSSVNKSGSTNSDEKLILVPEPSDSPDDPLVSFLLMFI